jgi:hypothetical protein
MYVFGLLYPHLSEASSLLLRLNNQNLLIRMHIRKRPKKDYRISSVNGLDIRAALMVPRTNSGGQLTSLSSRHYQYGLTLAHVIADAVQPVIHPCIRKL